MARRKRDAPFDRELSDLAPEARWRTWMNRVEAVIFAAASPVSRESLAKVVGINCPIEALIADIRAELVNRPYDLVTVAGGWHHRTRPGFAAAILVGQGGGSGLVANALSATDVLIVATIAYHQPLTRRDLERLLGRAIDGDAVARLRSAGLVAPGPRSPRPGSPLTYVTTRAFLDRFSLESLDDLPDMADLRSLGLLETSVLTGTPAGPPPSASGGDSS